MPGFFSFVLDLLDPPQLVYQVTFGNGAPNITTNTLNTETSLLCTATNVPGQDNDPPTGPIGNLTGGLVLSITRPAGHMDDLAMICSTALPPLVKRFRLRATGSLDAGSNAFDPQDDVSMSTWAPVVVAHDIFGEDLTGFTPNGATQQVRYGPKIALGTAAAPGSTPPATEIPQNQAYSGVSERTFILEADINCHDATGTSRLTTSAHTWPPRYWSHMYHSPDGDVASGFQRAGVGLAIARGTGRATATFTRFEVWKWTANLPWWRRFLIHLVARVNTKM